MKRGTAGKCASFLFGIWYKKGLVMCTQYFGRVNRERFTKIINKTVCSYHVTYAFQSESTLYSCLNVKEVLARNRCIIWSLSDCNWTRTQNHLACKWAFNHLDKLMIECCNHIIKKDFLKAISDKINPKTNCFYKTTIQLKLAIKLIQSLMHFVAKYL